MRGSNAGAAPATGARKSMNRTVAPKTEAAITVVEERWETLASLPPGRGVGGSWAGDGRGHGEGSAAIWLGLCPDNRISGGRILKCRTRNRVKGLPGHTRFRGQP